VGRFGVELRVRFTRESPLELLAPVAPASVAAQPVDRAVSSGLQQPGPRLGGNTTFGPVLEGGDGGVLQRILREVDVAKLPAEDRQDASPVLADGALDLAARSLRRLRPPFLVVQSNFMTGRTSTDPNLADGIFAAHSIASSRFSHSTR